VKSIPQVSGYCEEKNIKHLNALEILWNLFYPVLRGQIGSRRKLGGFWWRIDWVRWIIRIFEISILFLRGINLAVCELFEWILKIEFQKDMERVISDVYSCFSELKSQYWSFCWDTWWFIMKNIRIVGKRFSR